MREERANSCEAKLAHLVFGHVRGGVQLCNRWIAHDIVVFVRIAEGKGEGSKACKGQRGRKSDLGFSTHVDGMDSKILASTSLKSQ